MRHTFKAILTATALSFTTLPLTVLAQGVPTVDTQNITQQIRQLQQMLQDFGVQNDQLDSLLEQIAVLEEKLAVLQKTYSALTGATDIKDLLMGGNLDSMLTPEITDVLTTLRGIQNGDWSGLKGEQSTEMRTKIEKVLEDAGFDKDSLNKIANSGTAQSQNMASQATTGAVMSAAAENSHAEAAVALERVEKLVALIPEMETVKASVDHNTRVTAELAIALTKMWELEAIQTIGVGQEGVTDAATIALEQRFMDFSLPELK